MIGVVRVILHVASAGLFPSNVLVVCAAGVHTLLRCPSPHVGRPKHAPALTVTASEVLAFKWVHVHAYLRFGAYIPVCSYGRVAGDSDARSVCPEREHQCARAAACNFGPRAIEQSYPPPSRPASSPPALAQPHARLRERSRVKRRVALHPLFAVTYHGHLRTDPAGNGQC
jgi:hypothetical protein